MHHDSESSAFAVELGGGCAGILYSYDKPREQTVALSGNGIEPATLTPYSTVHAKQQVGTTSAAKAFTLTNRQTVPLSNICHLDHWRFWGVGDHLYDKSGGKRDMHH